MSTPSTAELLACAMHAAETTANHARQNRDRRRDVYKALKNDIKLELDIECQKLAESLIRNAFPEHTILGEEDESIHGADAHQSDYRWIIDPIDGTVNFSHGFPVWCCTIAVQHKGETVAGVVHAPALGEWYCASIETPALRNGEPIHVSSLDTLRQAMVMTGLDRNPDPNIPPLTLLGKITSRVQRTRVVGCAAVDMCQVACGNAEGYFETGIYLWDVAAAGLIVQRAGGKAECTGTFDEPHKMRFLATNGLIHDELKKIVTL